MHGYLTWGIFIRQKIKIYLYAAKVQQNITNWRQELHFYTRQYRCCFYNFSFQFSLPHKQGGDSALNSLNFNHSTNFKKHWRLALIAPL